MNQEQKQEQKKDKNKTRHQLIQFAQGLDLDLQTNPLVITKTDDTCFGNPRIQGTRSTVESVLNGLVRNEYDFNATIEEMDGMDWKPNGKTVLEHCLIYLILHEHTFEDNEYGFVEWYGSLDV